MKDAFLALYQKDLEITGGSQMETFLKMVVKQTDKSNKIHLEIHVKEVAAKYSDYIKGTQTISRRMRPKKV